MTEVVTIATLLWDANASSMDFSTMYDETWVERLAFGFRRNLTVPHRFVCFVDRPRLFEAGIDQEMIASPTPTYACCIEPYRLNEPMILVGLDTVVTGNCDHLAEYCLTADRIALPRDPLKPSRLCNGVALVPGGHRAVHDRWRGENDMEWMRRQGCAALDDLFPGQILSYRVQVKRHGLGDARIVYFHGREKPHELSHLDWIEECWQ